MRGDIVARLARVIVAQAVGERVEPARRTLGARRSRRRLRRIAHEQFEQRHRVGRRPFARRPRLVPADRARRREPHQRHPAVELDNRHRAGGVEADPAARAVGQASPRSRPSQPLVELVDASARTTARQGGRAARRRWQSRGRRAPDGRRAMPLHEPIRTGVAPVGKPRAGAPCAAKRALTRGWPIAGVAEADRLAHRARLTVAIGRTDQRRKSCSVGIGAAQRGRAGRSSGRASQARRPGAPLNGIVGARPMRPFPAR